MSGRSHKSLFNPRVYAIPFGSLFVMLALTFAVATFNDRSMDTRSKAVFEEGVYPGTCPQHMCISYSSECTLISGTWYSFNCTTPGQYATGCTICTGGSCTGGLCVAPTPTVQPTPTPYNYCDWDNDKPYCDGNVFTYCHPDTSKWTPVNCQYGCSVGENINGCKCVRSGDSRLYLPGDYRCVSATDYAQCDYVSMTGSFITKGSCFLNTSCVDFESTPLSYSCESINATPTRAPTQIPTPTPKPQYRKIDVRSGVSCNYVCSRVAAGFRCLGVGTEGSNGLLYDRINRSGYCYASGTNSISGCGEIISQGNQKSCKLPSSSNMGGTSASLYAAICKCGM